MSMLINKIHSILFLLSVISVNAQITGVVFVDTNNNHVFDKNEKILSGIMVSNGIDVVKTNQNGQYTIVPKGKPLFIIKPKGYISPINKYGVVDFSILPPYTNKDFPLVVNKEGKKVKAVILGDPQADVIDDVHHIGKLVIEELACQKFDFMIPVGDLSFDNHDIFPDLSRTLGTLKRPVFYTIGNHDIDLSKNIKNASQKYEEHFGASYYAFKYGNEDFLVLNNIFPIKNNKYEGRINQDQYTFIANYLKNINTEKLTIFMHIPLDQMENKKRFLTAFKGIENVFIVAGHTHTQYHKYFEVGEKKSIHEVVVGAVCGSWWQGPHDLEGIPFALMNDGTEKGYWFANFYNNSVDYTYKVSGKPAGRQMSIWAPEQKEWSKELNKLNEPFIYANVFAGDENTKVELSFDGEKWFPMKKYIGKSPYLKRLIYLQNLGRFKSAKISKIPELKENSKHLWRILIPKNLKTGTYLITVRAKNKKLKLNTTNYKVFWNKEQNKFNNK